MFRTFRIWSGEVGLGCGRCHLGGFPRGRLAGWLWLWLGVGTKDLIVIVEEKGMCVDGCGRDVSEPDRRTI